MQAVSFDEAMEMGDEFIISPYKKTQNKGVFTNLRVDRNTIPEGWFAYDIRGGSESDFLAVEKEPVVVNHTGTFLTQQSIKFNNGRDYKRLTCGYTFVN